MRREDMVFKIRKFIEENMDASNLKEELVHKLADQILYVMEHRGVLPPASSCPVLFRKKNDWDE